MTSIYSIIRQLGPYQWIKNLLVFAPLFFSHGMKDIKLLIEVTFIFILFCSVSSAVCCLNDVLDCEVKKRDSNNSKKLVSLGIILKQQNILLMFLFLVVFCVVVFAVRINYMAPIIIAGYFLLNVCYSLFLRKFAIVDVMCLAIGFVLRIFAGGSVGIWISQWIIITTFLLALFCSLYDCRLELMIREQTGMLSNKIPDGYNLDLVNVLLAVVSAVTVVSYIMYTLSEQTMDRLGSKNICSVC